LDALLTRDPGLLEVRDDDNLTPLMCAARTVPKRPQLVKSLLNAKAEISVLDADGYSALFHLFTVSSHGTAE
jgi:ankyrin repeat protein